MPVYAYKCESCNHICKLMHGTDENPGNCSQCQNNSLRKQFLPTSNIRTNNGEEAAKRRIEKYIEETRESVRQQTEEARKDYTP